MVQKLNFDQKDILERLGATDLSPEAQDQLLATMTSTLQTRVGMRLEDELTDEQLLEFSELSDSNKNDDEAAVAWLTTNVPHYQQIISEELDEVIDDIKSGAENILKSVE